MSLRDLLRTHCDPSDAPSWGPSGKKTSTPFRKQLGWHIQNPPAGSVVFNITPADATELLKRNEGDSYVNRPQSAATIEKYVRAMRAGWTLTGETIILSRSGRLLNGQHRLEACVQAGCSFKTHVVFGIDDDAFSVVDSGKKRTAGDIFGIQRVPNANMIAAATLWVWRYENTGMASPHAAAAPTSEELYAYYQAQTGLQDSHTAGHRFHEERLASPSLMVALHYLCAKQDRAAADTFFHKLANGVGIVKKTEPAAALRKLLIRAAQSPSSKIEPLFVAAFTVMAWNATRERETISAFRWRNEQSPDKAFPSIV